MTTHRRLSASGLDLAAACPSAFALPAVEDAETDAMRAGTGRHAYLSAVARAWNAATESGPDVDLDAVRSDALAEVPADAPWRSTCEGIDLAALLDGVVSVEADLSHVLRLDRTAVQTTVASHRAYSDAEGVPGTLDWLVRYADGRVRVIDFKGMMGVDRAADHVQLALYALHACRARALDSIEVEIVNVEEDGSLRRDAATLDGWDLDAAEARILEVHHRVIEARAQVAAGETSRQRVGDHCGRCAALRVCPAQVALVRELAVSPPDATGLAALSDEAAGVAWEKLDALDTLIGRMRAALRVRAERAGLPLSDGRRLTPVESSRRSLDVKRALPVLREIVGDRADGLVELSLEASAVDCIAREIAKGTGTKVRQTTEEVWGKLRAAGAVRDSKYVQLRARAARSGSAS